MARRSPTGTSKTWYNAKMLPKSQARCSITPAVQGRFSDKIVLPENQSNYCQRIAFGNVVALNARSQENLAEGNVVIESHEELGIFNSWQLELAHSLSLSLPLSKKGWLSLLSCTNHVRILLAAIKHGWPWGQVPHDHIILSHFKF